MLYPDLRRLALVCPTGGTNDEEAGGSNDPLPPSRSRARPGEGDEAPATAQEEALASEDILHSILLALVDGTIVDVCRAAARWCFLNKAHMAACDDGVWEQLTRVVFPNYRAPNTGRAGRSDEPTNPKDWFFHLCTQNKRYRDLMGERIKIAIKRTWTKTDADREYLLAASDYTHMAFDRELLLSVLTNGFPPDRLPDKIHRQLSRQIEKLETAMNQLSNQMDAARRRGAKPVASSRRRRIGEEEDRVLREMVAQEDYQEDLMRDPEEQTPPTAREVIRQRRAYLSGRDRERDLAHLALLDEAERKRQERTDLAEQYRAWLAALNQMNPREAALSRLIAEARELVRRGIADVRPNVESQMQRTLARIDKERRRRHTFANTPELMSRLEGELARDVNFIKAVMDESVTVHDLFGSEGEDEEG